MTDEQNQSPVVPDYAWRSNGDLAIELIDLARDAEHDGRSGDARIARMAASRLEALAAQKPVVTDEFSTVELVTALREDAERIEGTQGIPMCVPHEMRIAADRLEALTQPSGKVSDEQVERAAQKIAEAHRLYGRSFTQMALAALETALSSGEVRVKPLQWCEFGDMWQGRGFGSHYDIYQDRKRYRVWLHHRSEADFFKTLEGAKAACEAEYAERILAAIEPTQAQGEGVDWERIARTQSRKLQAVIAIPGAREALEELDWKNDDPMRGWDFVQQVVEDEPAPSRAVDMEVVGLLSGTGQSMLEAGESATIHHMSHPQSSALVPLVRLTDAQAAIAAKDVEIDRLQDMYERATPHLSHESNWMKRAKSAEARVAALEKALKPFANVPLLDATPDAPRGMWVSVPFGWLQDARAALHPEKEKSNEA